MTSLTTKIPSLAKIAATTMINDIVNNVSDDVEVEIDEVIDPFKISKDTKQQVFIKMGIDSTASMKPVIATAKNTAEAIVKKIEKMDFDVNIEIASVNDWQGMIPFDDQKSPVTWNVDIDSIEANGGGDTPEAYSTFIMDACQRLSTSDDNALRFIILLGDAYAHGMPPIQNRLRNSDSFKDGDPNGNTIPGSMSAMKKVDATFIMVQAESCENGKLWAATNAKYTDGTVIPMDMEDMEKVPEVLSSYIASQTSMVATILKKRHEMKGKEPEEIAKLLAEHMKENEEHSMEVSETVEHSAADEFIKSVEEANKTDKPGVNLYRSFSQKLKVSDSSEDWMKGSYRCTSDGKVKRAKPNHYRSLGGSLSMTREVSATIMEMEPGTMSQGLRRASKIASKMARKLT